jgi:hypothetical protein
VTKPVPGNHEYFTTGAAGYFDYFGAIAGDRAKGYYSYDIGSWHVVALNSNCALIGGCAAGSAEEAWLRADLAGHPQACTLAYWHHPRFSSGGEHGNDTTVQPLWQALQDARADVILTGHDHTYERFAAQRADGVADANGVVEFVAGAGGKNHYPLGVIKANSVFRNTADFGVLKMTLHNTSYDWQFVTDTGAVLDSGTAACVLAAAATPASTPAAPIAKAKTSAAKATAPAATDTPQVSATPQAGQSPAATAKPKAKSPHSSDLPAERKPNFFMRAVHNVSDFFVTAWKYWTGKFHK